MIRNNKKTELSYKKIFYLKYKCKKCLWNDGNECKLISLLYIVRIFSVKLIFIFKNLTTLKDYSINQWFNMVYKLKQFYSKPWLNEISKGRNSESARN